MFKILTLAIALPFISFSPQKPSFSEEMIFCDGVKFISKEMQVSRELKTLKGESLSDARFSSKITLTGWDMMYIADDEGEFNFNAFSEEASETIMKKKFKDTRLQLIECLKLDPAEADEDNDELFSFLYYPDDRPEGGAALFIDISFYARSKELGSFISISIRKLKG